MKNELVEIINNVNEYLDREVYVCGWIKNHRKQKEFGFIDVFDGT